MKNTSSCFLARSEHPNFGAIPTITLCIDAAILCISKPTIVKRNKKQRIRIHQKRIRIHQKSFLLSSCDSFCDSGVSLAKRNCRISKTSNNLKFVQHWSLRTRSRWFWIPIWLHAPYKLLIQLAKYSFWT